MPRRRSSFLTPLNAATAFLLLAAVGCREEPRATDRSGLLADAGGDVAVADEVPAGLDYTVTSEDYRRWMFAEGALASVGIDDLSTRIPLQAATDADVERVAAVLEQDARVRTAIESSGLGVEDYVRTTIALEQAMAAATPGTDVRFRDVPAENIIIADRNRAEVERTRKRSPVRISRSRDRLEDGGDDDDDDNDGDEWSDDRKDRDDDARGRRKGRGGRGRGRG